MTRIVSNTALNMDTGLTFSEITSGQVVTATSTEIVAQDGNRTLRVTGQGITYDVIGLPNGGVINSAVLTVGGVVALEITQGSVAVTTMRAALISGNFTAFKQELLAGNDVIYGSNLTNASDILFGLGGNDQIFGRAGNDTLRGDAGNDTLNGGAGIDSMTGGIGNDTYYVDNRNDIVIENADEGTDVVRTSTNFVVPLNVELMILEGTADLSAVGNAQDNRIIGNAGNNTINGREGVDRMEGGAGNDTYIVDNIADRAIETAGNGYDIVQSIVTYNASGQDIERIQLLGGAAANVTGNDLNNVIIGNSANNGLDGGKGGDRMAGGLGDDVYAVDAASDVVIEKAGQGIDTVRSVVSHTLAANVEKLVLEGTAAIGGLGNELDNTIIGNGSANALAGLGGRDTLTGGAGADRFVFKAVSESSFTQYDRITDYASEDSIDLRAIDANTAVAGNQDFVRVAALTGAAGQLSVSYNAGNGFTTILADVDGGGADFRIVLNGDHDGSTGTAADAITILG